MNIKPNNYLIIPIASKNHGVMNVLIDEDDEKLFLSRKWYVYKSTGTYYVTSQNENRTCMTSLHKFLLNTPAGFQVDHINRNGLDNRRCNLRIVTKTQNTQNRRVHGNNKTGFKGVSPKKWRAGQRFAAVIRVNKKTILGGYFKTAVEAAKRYNELAKIHHGEFAYQNIIP